MTHMSRYESIPNPKLQQDIQCFWVVEEAYNPSDLPHVVLPDPYRELVINCGAPVMLETEHLGPMRLPRVYLNGLQHQPLRIRPTGPLCIVGVRFYPWAARAFLEMQSPFQYSSIAPLAPAWDSLQFGT